MEQIRVPEAAPEADASVELGLGEKRSRPLKTHVIHTYGVHQPTFSIVTLMRDRL